MLKAVPYSVELTEVTDINRVIYFLAIVPYSIELTEVTDRGAHHL